MPVELIITPEASRDLAEAYAYYQDQKPGLGEEFFRCVEASVEMLCRHPQMNAVVHESYRRALVRRFPYAIFYEHAGDAVTIYAVFHAARDPEKWRHRLR